MGSYVLVSHQSQTCSSHYTEPCITTRTPLDPAVRRGNLLILKYDEDPMVREKKCAVPELEELVGPPSLGSPDYENHGRSLLLQKELLGSGMQRVKALQEDVDDKEAEQETRIYVGYIRHVYLYYIIYS